MARYAVENKWGEDTWAPGGTWVLGNRKEQNVDAVEIQSSDKGESFTGTMTYAGEGPIDVQAKNIGGNKYEVDVRWGGDEAPWHGDGVWVIGGREEQRCVALNVSGADEKLDGSNTYEGEGPIDFRAVELND